VAKIAKEGIELCMRLHNKNCKSAAVGDKSVVSLNLDFLNKIWWLLQEFARTSS